MGEDGRLKLIKTITFLLLSDRSSCRESLRILSWQQIGIAKLSGFLKWLSMHPIFAESDGADNLELGVSSHKMIIFAHHHKVLDGVQVRHSVGVCFLHANWKPV